MFISFTLLTDLFSWGIWTVMAAGVFPQSVVAILIWRYDTDQLSPNPLPDGGRDLTPQRGLPRCRSLVVEERLEWPAWCVLGRFVGVPQPKEMLWHTGGVE